ncbi:MAG: OmpH family outer membrane protein [Flavobacteriales bacterium]
MRSALFPLFFLVVFPFAGEAQRFAYVNTDRVLRHIPEYHEAQKRLKELANKWQREIQQKHKRIDKLYNSLQAEEVLLTEEMKKKREQKISKKKREVRKLQKKRFGKNGDLYKKRKELLQPLQDKVYKAIKKLAERKDYDMILDSNKGSNVLYATAKYDLTEDVIEELGYKPGDIPGQGKEKKGSKSKAKQKKGGDRNKRKRGEG